jgi:FkbH-like protein
MSELFRDLLWLPACPDNFNAMCRAALESEGDFGAAIRHLASFGLDGDRLIRLSKTIEAGRERGKSVALLKPFSLGLASNGTSDYISAAVKATAARYGLQLTCVATGYDQFLQDSLSPESPLNRATPDAVLIALDWRSLPLRAVPGDGAVAEAAIAACLDYLDTIREAIHRNSGAACLVQNLAAPAEGIFGSLDRRLSGTMRSMVDRVNAGLVDRLQGSADVLFDVARLAETVGLVNWHSPGEWNLAKLPFAQEFVPLYADHVCRLVAAQRGLSRRCLVVDLDNTLWGGVIGDDGVAGIAIGQGDATGEAYLDLQRYLLTLRDRGVVLAVSSKNEEEAARLPFHEHPDMLLREGDFAVFQANWNDKATNIQAIADTLALGVDALVFVDDNPFERELVRRALPSVAVPEMPEDPALYARTLSAAGYFEAVAFLEEDRRRALYYSGNAQRARLERQVGDLAGYLASLEMEIEFQPFNEVGRARITQLINKSNQFNLTTRRYDEREVASFESDRGALALQVRLRDRFGDNGMISVVICRWTDTAVGEIDTWLMSCRVLGRRVEEAVLHELLAHARRRGVSKLRGNYIPTSRNKLVENHYAKLGFARADGSADGTTVWELDVASARMDKLPMAVRSSGFGRVSTEVAQ